MSSLVLQKALYGHCVVKPDFLQLFDGAHGRSDCNNFAPAFVQRPVKFLQRGSFSGSRSTMNVDCQVTTSQNKVNGLPLLKTQLAGQFDFDVAERVKLANAPINTGNHVVFSLKCFAGGNVFSRAEQFAATFLKRESAPELI